MLSLEAFTAKYFPQYVKEWRPSYAIRLRKDGRPVRMANAGDSKRQATRRAKILGDAYAQYTFLKTENDKTQSPRAPQSETPPAGIHNPGARGL